MKRRRIGIYILLEGLGAQFVRTHDFLPEFEFRSGLRSVLGDRCAARASLLTGRLPREHGFGTHHPRRREATAFAAARKYNWLPGFIANHGAVRRQIREEMACDVGELAALEHCPTGLLPEFDYVDTRLFYEVGGVEGSRSIFDSLPGRGLRFRVYPGKDQEHRELTAAEEDIFRGDVDFLFLALPSLGRLMEGRGPESRLVHERSRWVESWIRRLQEAAENVAEVAEIFVMSDHGTSHVHGRVDLVSPLEREFGRNGGHYLAFYDSTMVRLWCEDEPMREDLVRFLSLRTEGRRLPAEELELLGWNPSDPSQGHEIFLLNEGLQFVPSYVGDQMKAGMSGYHPDALGSEAVVLGLWSPSEDLRHVTDLHRLMTTTAERLAEE